MRKGSYTDMSGMVFNGVLIGTLHHVSKQGTFWNCDCHCGTPFVCRGINLKRGHTVSCGCRGLQTLKEGRETHGRSNDHDYKIWKDAKGRAKKLGRPFSIDVDDIVIPETCPILGTPIERSKHNSSNNSPSLDCFDPAKGYSKGNVWVISQRANWLKRELTLEEWKQFVSKLEENSGRFAA